MFLPHKEILIVPNCPALLFPACAELLLVCSSELGLETPGRIWLCSHCLRGDFRFELLNKYYY